MDDDADGCPNFPDDTRKEIDRIIKDRLQRKKQRKHHTLLPEHLKTGFGIHSHTSLELAIKAARDPPHICACPECDAKEAEESTKSGSTQTSTLLGTISYERIDAKKKLKYLMGLKEGDEEEEGVEVKPSIETIEQAVEDYITGTSAAMRKAQLYLREHKIFEYFQFLIAHLLAEAPYDPISFLINLMDKCLLYRSGIGDPPLLYNKKHIGCLFNLMDRMRTGFIDTKQYKTGMLTFGIKSYNINPPVNDEGKIPKHFFVEEAFECLKDLLNDMIRKRLKPMKKTKKLPKAPPPSVHEQI